MDSYSPAQPIIVVANNAIVPINKEFSFITFTNNGAGAGTIDFQNGNVCTLAPGATLSLPYLGRVYGSLTINAVGTIIEALYVY